jgi:hypothetical protein
MRNNITVITILILAMFVMQSCKKDYLNRPPLASPTAGTYYRSDGDILNGTGPLYNVAWGGYNGTSLQYIGDVMGGNSTSDNYNGRGSYLSFTVTSSDPSGALQSAYQSLWSVVANANVVAYNIKNAECYFIRAAAYYYLALDWGAVPIIYNNTVQLGDTSIRKNDLADVWKFIISDLTWSMNHLAPTPLQPGRITKWSAEGMLGRAYLVRSGLGQSGGQRTQSDLDSAKLYLGDVCNNSGLILDPSYYDLFTSSGFSGNKVPPECLFALLWVPSSNNYQSWNHMQANLAYDSKITQTGDGWGGAFGASPSLIQYYTDPANAADSVRRKATLFMPNTFYPDINKANGGWLVDTTLFNTATNSVTGLPITSPVDTGTYYGNNHAYVKKYVIGSPADNGGLGSQQNENIGTYMFRLSEVYLDYADAILSNNGSTSDPEALKYYNAVRIRAGIAPKASFSYADLTLERKIEFAFEGQTWYDWKTWYYFDPTNALNYFNTQNRGVYNLTYNGGNSFVTYLNDATNPASIGPHYYTITSATADLPYPEVELLVAHNLTLAPVPFDFSKLNY